MTKVTLKEMCDQLGKISPSRLDFNVANFATEVGQYSKGVFKKSFDTQSFDGKAWKPRESRWGKRFTHPILNDTGTLKDSFPIVEGNDFASSTSRKDTSARRSDGKLPFKRISPVIQSIQMKNHRLFVANGEPDVKVSDMLPYTTLIPEYRHTP